MAVSTTSARTQSGGEGALAAPSVNPHGGLGVTAGVTATAALPSRGPRTALPSSSHGSAETRSALSPWDTQRGTAPGEVQDPSPCITLQAAKHSLSVLPVLIYNFTQSGVIIIERTYKHTVPSHATAQRRAGELSPSSLPSEPTSPALPHTQPAPTPHAWLR